MTGRSDWLVHSCRPIKTASLAEWSKVTAGQGVFCPIPGSGKVLLGYFRFFEKLSVVTRSLELCPVYGNRLTPITWDL
ncbi:hypothetical protein SFRURICE_011277 [Spodoptera frugiperda]|nr:hypothetical protein SFRURICE_011277 [Spodoptera frugiperda]